MMYMEWNPLLESSASRVLSAPPSGCGLSLYGMPLQYARFSSDFGLHRSKYMQGPFCIAIHGINIETSSITSDFTKCSHLEGINLESKNQFLNQQQRQLVTRPQPLFPVLLPFWRPAECVCAWTEMGRQENQEWSWAWKEGWGGGGGHMVAYFSLSYLIGNKLISPSWFCCAHDSNCWVISLSFFWPQETFTIFSSSHLSSWGGGVLRVGWWLAKVNLPQPSMYKLMSQNCTTSKGK